ncbi:ABC transporter permease subunit [Clostridium intestinale]|uniref:ABC-type dipeptide/oligopeptide/nickel transport system, permease component n=1 Tax=Clostridium intestinale DSM 6191 TaxID=1121320 RepID=A0A1M5ZES7_9CLOT|nr:ABC transporter permease subunit [Clostridium intestinale]SHI22765.1 ABC-type dipeptide/oligopeptide/nickel transport system, permease component [Clostridium intestinale DSM 6191]
MLKWGRGLAGFFACIIIVAVVLVQINIHKFNNAFEVNNVAKNTEELSKLETNEDKVKYIENYFEKLGTSPGGEEGTYLQNFNTMIPVYNSTPSLYIKNNDSVVRSFVYGEDFRESLLGFGGNGDVSGKIYLLEDNMSSLSKDILKNNIILSSRALTDEDIDYAVNNGCKAIMMIDPDVSKKESVDTRLKQAKSTIIYRVSQRLFSELSSNYINNLDAHLKVDVSFKMESSPNILSKIHGKSKSAGYSIISAHISDDNSGIALLMEYARVLKMQDNTPEKTIVFAVWNSFDEGMKGSNYYVENPIYPLKETEVFVLDDVASLNSRVMNISTYGKAGQFIMNKLSDYAMHRGIRPNVTNDILYNDSKTFLLKDTPAVLINGDRSGGQVSSYEFFQQGDFADAGQVLLNYIQRDIYKDWSQGMIQSKEKSYIITFVIVFLIMYLFKSVYKTKPSIKLLGISAENIYYSSIFNVIDKIVNGAALVGVIIFITAFIVYIPSSFDLVKYNGSYISNHSIYFSFESTIEYIRNFFDKGLGKTDSGFSVAFIISFSIIKSIGLILSSVILAFIVGTSIGIISSFKNKKRGNISFIGPIAMLSLPDVLIAISVQLLFIILRQNNILHSGSSELTKFLLPFISLAIIPTAYISRIAQIAVKEEITKDYIMAARAKGLSTFNILKDHLLISVAIKVVETLPSVLNIIVSNVIIVEYVFSYPGIVYQLFSYFKDYDIRTCVGLIIGIGVVYFILTAIFKGLSIIINPFKRRAMIGGKQNEKA